MLALFSCLSRVNVGNGEFFAWEDGTQGVNVLSQGFSVEVVVSIRAAIVV
jgi:hypothetical protein